MQVNLIVQKDGNNTLTEKIKLGFKDAKKVYLVCGTLKEGGFNIIEEELLDTKIKSFFVVGIDKKNTTKSMLESMLKLSKDSYYYKNNYDVEFNSSMIVVERKDDAIIYSMPTNISESTLDTNISEYFEIIYDLNDKNEKEEYKQKVKDITSLTSDERFTNLTKEKIEELIENKEIFSTRQYNHNVLSISELLEKTSSSKEEVKQNVVTQEKEIPKVDLSDIDLDIEMPEIEISDESLISSKKEKKEKEEEEISLDIEDEEILPEKAINFVEDVSDIDENNELYDEELLEKGFDENEVVDINDLLFTKSDMKLQKKEIKEDKNEKEEDRIEVKKLNLNNVSNLLMELPSRPSKGQDLKNVKVPNYIRTLIPDFFELNDNAKNEVIDGSSYKLRDIEIEIVNAKTEEKFTDRNAKIMQKQGQTYTTFTTPILENIVYNENDIVRIIKLSSNVYHLEFIPQDINEYKIWSKICNQKMKSSTRSYGMM